MQFPNKILRQYKLQTDSLKRRHLRLFSQIYITGRLTSPDKEGLAAKERSALITAKNVQEQIMP